MSNVSSRSAAPASVPWNVWVGLAFIVVVFYMAQLFSGLLLSVYPALRHWSGSQASDWLNNSVSVQFMFILVAEVLTVGAIYLFLRRHKLSLAFIGLRRPRLTDPLWGLLAVPVYYALFGLLLAVASHLFPSLNISQKQELGFDKVVGHTQLLLTFLSLVVLPPLAEEIVFRGFMYQTLRKSRSVLVAGLITSVLFGAGHLAEGGSAGPLYVGALQTFTLSVVLIYLREKTGSLWAGITLHAGNNAIAFMVLFVLHSN